MNTKVSPFKSLYERVICNYNFILYKVWVIYSAWWLFFYYSIASFDMLLSVCNRTIMKSPPVLIWERIPSISIRETVILLPVGVLKLSIPVISTPHDVLWRRYLSEPHWFVTMKKDPRISSSTHLMHKVVVTQTNLFFYFMHLCTYLRLTGMCAVCYLLNNAASMTVIVYTPHTSCIVYLWCLNFSWNVFTGCLCLTV